jgi:hypothetical protein
VIVRRHPHDGTVRVRRPDGKRRQHIRKVKRAPPRAKAPESLAAPGLSRWSASRRSARRAPRPHSQPQSPHAALGCDEQRRLQDDRVRRNLHIAAHNEDGPCSSRRSIPPKCLLTVKLSGRPRRKAALRSDRALRSLPMRPTERRGRILSSGARGSEPPTPHGPLQRLLEGTHMTALCACGAPPASEGNISPA